MESRPFAGNILTSDPVRYARNAAILEAEPALGARSADCGLDRCRVSRHADMREHSYPSRIRQPMLIMAAGNDAWCRMRRSRISPACCALGRNSSLPAPITKC